MERNQYYNIAIGLCCLIWCVSLFVPAIDFNFGGTGISDSRMGIAILFWGWMAVIGLQTAWFANVAFWLVVLGLNGKFGSALKWAVIALFFCTLHSIDLLIRPDYNLINALQIGYWLWMTANFALCGVAVKKLIEQRNDKSADPLYEA